MSFGKKKSNLPRGQTQSLSRGLKTTAHNAVPTLDLEANTTMSFEDTGRLIAGLCEACNYPELIVNRAALYTIWLESRGLPSHGTLAKYLMANLGVPLEDRGIFADPNGRMVIRCPLIGTARTGWLIQTLVDAGPQKKIDFICEGPVAYLIPRLSGHAVTHNIALMIEVHPTDRYVENPTSLIIHENQFALTPGTTSLSSPPANILIRILPEDYMPPKSHFADDRLKRDVVVVQSILKDLIDEFRHKTGLSSELPFKNGIPSEIQAILADSKKPKLRVEMSEDTKAFFHSVIDTNLHLRNCFTKLSKGNRSSLGVIVFETDETKELRDVVLVTTEESSTGAFYKECEKLGWMQQAHEAGVSGYGFLNYQVTKTGLMGLSLLLAFHSPQ